MRSRALLPMLCLLLLLVLPGAAAAAPSAMAKVRECSTSMSEGKRFLVVQGRMRAVRGTDRMQIAFELRVRTPDRAGFRRLQAPGFGTWNTASAAARRYVFDKRVENLAAPAEYRMVVRFRWLDSDGEILEAARRTTKVCDQPDLRPDLSTRRVTIAPGPEPGTSRYVILVHNRGGSAAGPFGVTLKIGARTLPAESVLGLPAAGRTELEVFAPRCASGEIVAVQVDSEGAIEEASEADNALARTCPE